MTQSNGLLDSTLVAHQDTQVSAQPSLKHHWHLVPEYAPQVAVLMAWPHHDTDWASMLDAAELNFGQIAAAISMTATPWILVPNVEFQVRVERIVRQILVDNNWQQNHTLEFSICNYNDTWTRDYGPLCTFRTSSNQVGQYHLRLQDFSFNGWGNKVIASLDNQVNHTLWSSGELERVYTSALQPEKLSSVQFQPHSIVLEGGSLDTNGKLLLTTSGCLLNKNRNPNLAMNELEEQLQLHCGVRKVLWLQQGYLEGDDTDGHIDTLARFINKQTIVYQGCQDQNDSHFNNLQLMKQELQTLARIHDLQLIELPWPQAQFYSNRRLPATYANFLLCNQSLLLPIYGCAQDQLAINTLEQACPEFNVVAINCQTLIRHNGSLHCSTLQLPHIWSET